VYTGNWVAIVRVQTAIDHIERSYSGVSNYLLSCDISLERQAAVKRLVLMNSDEQSAAPGPQGDKAHGSKGCCCPNPETCSVQAACSVQADPEE
jgi:hypothetical protein